METDTAFIRADGVVELHAVAYVGLHLATVVCPCHTECNYAVRLYHALHYACFFKFGMLVIHILNAHEHLFHCLQILFFSGMFCLQRGHDTVNVHFLCFNVSGIKMVFIYKANLH